MYYTIEITYKRKGFALWLEKRGFLKSVKLTLDLGSIKPPYMRCSGDIKALETKVIIK